MFMLAMSSLLLYVGQVYRSEGTPVEFEPPGNPLDTQLGPIPLVVPMKRKEKTEPIEAMEGGRSVRLELPLPG